jgi:hypothetical protein
MNSNNDAVDCTHTQPIYTGVIQTTWANTKAQANAKAEGFRAEGADLSRIFHEPESCLGEYRIVGFFYTKA